MTSNTILITLWWLAILWTYTEIVPRPFDDWKNGLLYVGAGVLVILFTVKRNLAGSIGLRKLLSSLLRATAKPRLAVTALLPSPRKSGDPSEGVSVPPASFLFIVASYFLLCAVSIAVSPTGKYEGILELARFILWAGLAWAFAQCSVRTWIWLMRVTVVSAAVIALLTWLHSRGAGIWYYGGQNFLSPIGHTTYYGDFMALSLVMAMGVMFQHVILRATPEGSQNRSFTEPALEQPRSFTSFRMTGLLVYTFCTLLIAVGLALSATRASLVGVIAAMVLAIPLVGYASRSFKTVVIITTIGVLTLAAIFGLPIKSTRGGEPVASRLEHALHLAASNIEAASGGRWHMIATSAHITMKRPLTGWGMGTFRFVYPEFAHRNQQDSMVSSAVWCMHPHNEVLHQAVELGWTGAVLFLLGFAYLLYGGIRALRRSFQCRVGFISGSPLKVERHCRDDGILLITALCGLTAAFVSWQFSTNFLFPVSRLMTALFAGIAWQVLSRGFPSLRSSPDRHLDSMKPAPGCGAPAMANPPRTTRHAIPAIVLISSATLLLLANQISLICVQKQQTATTVESARNAAAWAVRLAPAAFDPLFVRASVALRTEPPLQAAPAVESLYESYPYVPSVLHMMGVLRAQQGNLPEARKFLQHALANDPSNSAAKQLLDQLLPGH